MPVENRPRSNQVLTRALCNMPPIRRHPSDMTSVLVPENGSYVPRFLETRATRTGGGQLKKGNYSAAWGGDHQQGLPVF